MTSALPGVAPNDAKAAMEVMLAKMAREGRLRYRIDNVFYSDLRQALEAHKQTPIDVLSLSSIDYLRIRSKIEMEPGLAEVPERDGADKYLLLVAHGMDLDKLAAKKKPTLIVHKGGVGDISLMWLDTILLERSMAAADSFFDTVRRVGKASRAVLPVFFNQADACVVSQGTYDAMVEMNPQVGREVTPLFKSPSLLRVLTCFRPRLSKDAKTTIREFTDGMDKSPETAQLLMILQAKRMVRFKPEHLASMESLYERHRILTAADASDLPPRAKPAGGGEK